MKDFIITTLRLCTSRTQILDIITATASRKDISNTDFLFIYNEAINLLKGV